MLPQIICHWDGEAFRPSKRFHNLCNAHFVVGEIYDAAFVEQRSMANHRHYFADLKTAWLNLPETVAGEFPTPEHFRARGLIETGFRDEFRFVCATSHQQEPLRPAMARCAGYG